ncbi:MAG TPA: GNAT family N-acetyltransferase [Candidatus Bathyarchaeia archaeon]|nr:GNAT family N-acetyltransferase [Candidatus Bathyarchaeia archaeon]
MKIVDLTAETIDNSISLCIGSKPGDEFARQQKRRWLESRIPQRAGGKLAYSDGQLVGMAEYTPVEDSPFPVSGKDLLHIHCIWVLPRFQGKGIGDELVKACVHQARTLRKTGLSVIACDDPLFMPASFFLHEGFASLDKRDHEELMWKDLENSRPPRFLERKYSPRTSSRNVLVNVLYCAQCPWSVKAQRRMESVAREFPDVAVQSIEVENRARIEQLGESRKVFVNGKEVFMPTPTEENLRTMLDKTLKESKLREWT